MRKTPGYETYSSFIDLVGIKDLAEFDSTAYYRNLEYYKEHVVNNWPVLRDCGGALSLFSDCAFIESPQRAPLFQFLRRLRHQLLIEGIYFKAAVSDKPLGKNETPENERNALGLSLTTFGVHAATLVGMQESLKGIGISVAHSIRDTFICQSFFIPQAPSHQTRLYNDLRLLPTDFQPETLDRVFQQMLRTKCVSTRTARYYVSFLILWVRSLEWQAVKIGKREFPISPEYVFHELVDPHMYSLLGDVEGMEFVYFAMLAKVFED
jgi:hypothetical protein